MDVIAFNRARANNTKDFLRSWMLMVTTTTTSEGVPALLRVVADGPFKHRRALMREAARAQYSIDENICNMVFNFFCRQVQKQYGVSASSALDNLNVSTPETDREFQARVDKSWVWESGSSEAARRALELPSGTGGTGSPVAPITLTDS